MGKHNIHDDHPLQYIRTRAGLTQQEFADRLGIRAGTLGKREAFIGGYEVMPRELHQKLAHEFGAFVIVDATKPPGPGYYRKPTGFGGVPYTAEYAREHLRGRIRRVKHSPSDVIEALVPVGKLCVMFKRETQFAEGLTLAIKGLCVAPQFKNAIIREIKTLITEEKFAAADWLCGVIEDDKLHRQIPTLPGDQDSQFKLIQEAKKLGARSVIANGNEIDLTKPLKKSDLLPRKK